MSAWVGFRDIGAWLLLVVVASTAGADDSRPNIVFLFADDLGYGDLSCYGADDIKTPHIDRLAAEGVRFTQHYANAPECSPTRTALLTGRYQHRVGGMECALGIANVGRYDDAIRLAAARDLGLPAEYSVLPSGLKAVGYSAAVFGKWHVGYEPKFNPLRHGWDEWFGVIGGNADYFEHAEENGNHVVYRDYSPVARKGYLTHLITDDAVEYIGRQHARPYFLYVPFTTPHTPYQGPDDETGTLIMPEAWNRGNRADHNKLVMDLDNSVGRILEALEKSGAADNTLVVFGSDNGALPSGSNAPWSGHKSTCFEGGIRVPLVLRWPGNIAPGTVCEQPCLTFDLTHSFLRLAGAQLPAERPLDGIDILEHVTHRRMNFPRTMFWRYRRGALTWRAVRDGDMKYISRVDGDQAEQWLFNLSVDPQETQNLLSTHPDDLARLKRLLADWEAEVRPAR